MDVDFVLDMTNAPKPQKSIHDIIADQLACDMGGIREVPNSFGRADVSTYDYVFEVKHITQFAHALGQSLGYAYATNKKPWVHLFGDMDAPSSELAEFFEKHNVKLTYQKVDM